MRIYAKLTVFIQMEVYGPEDKDRALEVVQDSFPRDMKIVKHTVDNIQTASSTI